MVINAGEQVALGRQNYSLSKSLNFFKNLRSENFPKNFKLGILKIVYHSYFIKRMLYSHKVF